MLDDESFQASLVDRRQIPLIIEWLLEVYTGKAKNERDILIGAMVYQWAAFEVKLLSLSKKLTVRQAFLVMQELIISENRAFYSELHDRAKFLSEKEEFLDVRSSYEERVQPDSYKKEVMLAKSADALASMGNDFIEV